MVDKAKVSSDWTDKERLAVIDAAVAWYWDNHYALPGRVLQDIQLLAIMTPEFLEDNRQNFEDYIDEA